MTTVYYCVEDALSRSILARLFSKRLSTDVHTQEMIRKTPGKSKLEAAANFKKLFESATRNPVVIFRDLDQHECPPSLRSYLISSIWKKELPEKTFLCIADVEAESWVLADRKNFSAFLGINERKISSNSKTHTKQYLLNLVKTSKNRNLNTMLPETPSDKLGPTYNSDLIRFVEEIWNPEEAAKNSDSLSYTIQKIDKIRQLL